MSRRRSDSKTAPCDAEQPPVESHGEIPHSFKAVAGAIVVLAAVILCVLVGPADAFTHGFFSDHPSLAEVREEDFGDSLRIGEEDTFVCELMPSHEHTVGFEVCVSNFDEVGRGGRVFLTVRDGDADVASGIVDLSQVADDPSTDMGGARWLHPCLDRELDVGRRYALWMRSDGCDTTPEIMGLSYDNPYGDVLDSQLCVAMAWRESSFTMSDKLLLCIMLLSTAALACSALMGVVVARRTRLAVVVALMSALMCWNFGTSFMCPSNDRFEGFQADSDSLVTFAMSTATDGKAEKASPYGLGTIEDVTGHNGILGQYELRNGDEWHDGYSWDSPEVALGDCEYVRQVATEGRQIEFANGERRHIKNVRAEDGWVICQLDGDSDLSRARLGDLGDIRFVSEDGDILPVGRWCEYVSSYGLQGKVFRILSRPFNDIEEAEEAMRLLVSILTTVTVMALVLLVRRKYGLGASVCLYAVMLLSPWVINFGNSLYWVPFLWFLPLVAGLAMSMCKMRLGALACCVGAFLSVAAKCLCGYEYMSTILLATVTPLVVDCVDALVRRHREQVRSCLVRIFAIGVAGLAGFAFALLLHARIRGGGSIAEGLSGIFVQDVLRRTVGGSLDAYESVYWPSLNASRWEVFLGYFSFPTDILAGIPGSLFPTLSVGAVVAVACAARRHDDGWPRQAAMLLMTFLAPVSWFVLAKSHSYIHVHMSYVLWYFGFVQAALWIVATHVTAWVLRRGNPMEVASERNLGDADGKA